MSSTQFDAKKFAAAGPVAQTTAQATELPTKKAVPEAADSFQASAKAPRSKTQRYKTRGKQMGEAASSWVAQGFIKTSGAILGFLFMVAGFCADLVGKLRPDRGARGTMDAELQAALAAAKQRMPETPKARAKASPDAEAKSSRTGSSSRPKRRRTSNKAQQSAAAEPSPRSVLTTRKSSGSSTSVRSEVSVASAPRSDPGRRFAPDQAAAR